jgi:hypothetical protein
VPTTAALIQIPEPVGMLVGLRGISAVFYKHDECVAEKERLEGGQSSSKDKAKQL